MAESILIREAEEKDLWGILEIFNDAILNTTACYDYEPHTLEMRKAWFKEKQESGHPVFVAEMKGKIAGFASYGYFRRAWVGYKYSVEHSVYVHQNFRRKGIARKLLVMLIEAARKNDFHAIVGGIDADNAASIKLHAELNFIEVAHFKQVGFKFNRWLDLKFFELVLDTPKNPVSN
jgi:L-amino acid N-acyltransferase YncA